MSQIAWRHSIDILDDSVETVASTNDNNKQDTNNYNN